MFPRDGNSIFFRKAFESALPIVVAHNLQGEEPDKINDNDADSYTAKNKAPFFEMEIFHADLLTFSITKMRR